MDKYNKLKEFYEKNGRLPKMKENLGGWLDKMRQAIKGNNKRKITENQKKLMDKTFPKWLFTRFSGESWIEKYNELKEFYDKYKRLPKQSENLGSWLTTMRMAVKGNGKYKITESQKDLMNKAFPTWLITYKSEEAWMDKYNKLKEFYEKNGRLPKRSENLGEWLIHMRQAVKGNDGRKITKNQKQLMDRTFSNWLITH
jgi:Sec-independent protein translocase protein TatA